ncbi:Hypothetical Protein FCC1311_083252 [Hondaea fermentalgiana]|uniref:Uncharacterized protein n=1 Tax=Hondaea fermentalgiana TaxID=2315210 RepID=A0A2R5GMJ4_9STRA|nr:Hypothetical Protein FCC1311_083252 [Hondaea fermentalgiana]|eukprot:GBG32100.1 Hypothetical Protein FCC1311_083252 [Hondaea fermentalgiana]
MRALGCIFGGRKNQASQQHALAPAATPAPTATAKKKKSKKRSTSAGIVNDDPSAGDQREGSGGKSNGVLQEALLAEGRTSASEVRALRQRLLQDHGVGDETPSLEEEVPRDLNAFMKYAKDVAEDVGPVRTTISRKIKRYEREQAEWARLEKLGEQANLKASETAICSKHVAEFTHDIQTLTDLDQRLDEASAQLVQAHESLRQTAGSSFAAISLLSSLGTQLNPPFRSVLLATRLARKNNQDSDGPSPSGSSRKSNKSGNANGNEEDEYGPGLRPPRAHAQESDGGLAPEEVCALVSKTKVLFSFASSQGGLRVARSIYRSFARDELNLAPEEVFIDSENLKRHRCSTTETADGVLTNPHSTEFFSFAMMMTHALIFVMDDAWQKDGWLETPEALAMSHTLEACYGDGNDTFYGIDFDLILAYPQAKTTLASRDAGKVLRKINEATEARMLAAMIRLGVPATKEVFFEDWADYGAIAARVAAAIERVSAVLGAQNLRRPKMDDLVQLYCAKWRPTALELEADALEGHSCSK